ncbi:MAG TPA: hypothetical protein VNN10_10345 [Dehalococcoidia bacterium]|nr:hypothetical protein [Dehalococcoidia bacterium]
MRAGHRDEGSGEGQARRALFLAQACYYLATGLWPILDRRTFEAITGPKREFWLVRTVGALATAIGAVLALAGARRRPSAEAHALAITSAVAFAAVDLNYVLRRRISPVYLIDALLESLLLLAWARALARRMPLSRADMETRDA